MSPENFELQACGHLSTHDASPAGTGSVPWPLDPSPFAHWRSHQWSHPRSQRETEHLLKEGLSTHDASPADTAALPLPAQLSLCHWSPPLASAALRLLLDLSFYYWISSFASGFLPLATGALINGQPLNDAQMPRICCPAAAQLSPSLLDKNWPLLPANKAIICFTLLQSMTALSYGGLTAGVAWWASCGRKLLLFSTLRLGCVAVQHSLAAGLWQASKLAIQLVSKFARATSRTAPE